MKKILLFLSLIACVSFCVAQKPDTVRHPKPIPAFRLLTTDSVWFTPANLKKGKPVIIIYFMPDCTHCQRLMYELKPKMDQLKNVQIVMVTFSLKYDIRAIREFYRDYDLKKYPNFTIGTEGTNILVQNYYGVRSTPFIAMYHGDGKWAEYIDKVPKVEQVLADAKKL